MLERDHGLTAFPSPEELLDQPGVNFVVIEGWDTHNPGYVSQAILRNQAIMLEKPGAPNLPAMRAMLDELRAHPVPFQIGYQLRSSPVIPHIQRILAEGVLGPITLVRTHAAAPVGGAAEPWQSVPGDLGGLLYTDGCHMIDLIVHLLGNPRSVKGSILKLPAGPLVRAHGYKTDTLLVQGDTVQIPLGGLMYEDGAGRSSITRISSSRSTSPVGRCTRGSRPGAWSSMALSARSLPGWSRRLTSSMCEMRSATISRVGTSGRHSKSRVSTRPTPARWHGCSQGFDHGISTTNSGSTTRTRSPPSSTAFFHRPKLILSCLRRAVN